MDYANIVKSPPQLPQLQSNLSQKVIPISTSKLFATFKYHDTLRRGITINENLIWFFAPPHCNPLLMENEIFFDDQLILQKDNLCVVKTSPLEGKILWSTVHVASSNDGGYVHVTTKGILPPVWPKSSNSIDLLRMSAFWGFVIFLDKSCKLHYIHLKNQPLPCSTSPYVRYGAVILDLNCNLVGFYTHKGIIPISRADDITSCDVFCNNDKNRICWQKGDLLEDNLMIYAQPLFCTGSCIDYYDTFPVSEL